MGVIYLAIGILQLAMGIKSMLSNKPGKPREEEEEGLCSKKCFDCDALIPICCRNKCVYYTICLSASLLPAVMLGSLAMYNMYGSPQKELETQLPNLIGASLIFVGVLVAAICPSLYKLLNGPAAQRNADSFGICFGSCIGFVLLGAFAFEVGLWVYYCKNGNTVEASTLGIAIVSQIKEALAACLQDATRILVTDVVSKLGYNYQGVELMGRMMRMDHAGYGHRPGGRTSNAGRTSDGSVGPYASIELQQTQQRSTQEATSSAPPASGTQEKCAIS